MQLFELERLPSPLAKVAQRFEAVGPHSSADSFLLLSYLAEAAIKSIGIALYAGLRISAPLHAYSMAYSLVRADGLGDWEEAITKACTHPVAGYLPPDFHQTLSWLTSRRSSVETEGLAEIRASVDELRQHLGMDKPDKGQMQAMRHVVRELVVVRNKTKAHGAFGPAFYESAIPPYLDIVRHLVHKCPVFNADWFHLSIRVAKGNVRGIRLRGATPQYLREAEAEAHRPSQPGVYLCLVPSSRAYWTGELLRTTAECEGFQFPNGGFKADMSGTFLDYASGKSAHVALQSFGTPPAPLPASETEGLAELEVQSNVFGNLPSAPSNYVERPLLQGELETRLRDRNHTIITLHGRGGIGKTSLALHVAHKLSEEREPLFEAIVWFSARDIDLRVDGPTSVKASVTSLDDISRSYGQLFYCPKDAHTFAQMLREPDPTTKKGRLLVFDNFETLDDARGVHQFLDTHTHIPNKVLITSRERAFKADYPIEVRGMEFAEALKLMALQSHALNIEAFLTEELARSIYDTTDGHPYVMRVVLGEMAKERSYVPPKTLIPRRLDIVQAVFERSFNKLSADGRWVFLLVGNWRSRVPELPLLVVGGLRGKDIETGIEECERLSLIERGQLADGHPCYRAPELARVFARRKLESDSDRLLLQEDSEVIRRFGLVTFDHSSDTSQPDLITRFLAWVQEEAVSRPGSSDKLHGLLNAVAELEPSIWPSVVDFRMAHGGDIEEALRRLVEERPFDKHAWLRRAQFAQDCGDEQTHIASLISAVDADPKDVELIREAAYHLIRFVDAKKYHIPEARRGVFLRGLRSHMEKHAGVLDATGLSRLAWLFMLEGDSTRARQYAISGLERETDNEHCRRILERIGR